MTVAIEGYGSFHGVLPEAITTNIWRTGFHDRSTTQLIELGLDEGDTFIDVGAHFGYFSVVASQLVGDTGKVVSIEAMPETFAFLLRNANSFPDSHECLQVAAWSQEGTVSFNDSGIVNSSLNSAFERRNPILSRHPETTVTVQTRTVDSIARELGLDQITGLKIDAESSELLVLEGMTEVLERYRPWVVVELGDPLDLPQDGVWPSSAIISEMEERGYAPFAIVDGILSRFEDKGRVRYANVVFRRKQL